MLRSVGALTFGPLSDHYGCKWPMVVALALFVVLELASGFCQTMPQFLAVRSRDGVAMGGKKMDKNKSPPGPGIFEAKPSPGMYGPAASTALADLPYDSRGVLSGIYQNGYSIGYLLAAVFYRALVPTTVYGWRSLFWFAAGPPVLLIIFRLWMPETNQSIAAKAEREARARRDRREAVGQEEPAAKSSGLAVFARETGSAVKQNWVLMIYMIVLMTGFNSCSHGSQDFFRTFLKTQAELNPTDVSIISIAGQLGSVTGSTILGFISTFSGRRLIMLIACVLGGALVPAYVLPRDLSLIAGTFFEQVFVGGVWGPVPIYLMELSPTALRATMAGLTYQLGNLASSAAATIQAVIGERFPLPDGPGGSDRFDYAKVIAVFMGAVWAYIFFFLLIGPEMSQEEREEEAKAVIARELGLWDDFLPLHAESKASE